LSEERKGTGRRLALEVLAAAFLFNLGQGVLRPSLPLFLQEMFAANYRMVTAIPVVFGAGRWVANLPTGYLLDRVGRRRLIVGGLLVIAVSDLACAVVSIYRFFLGLRGVAGAGWAMFGTIATTTMVDRSATERRGRRVSLLLMTETLGLLLGSAAGGWLYQGLGVVSPFVFEAGCMLVAALVVVSYRTPALDTDPSAPAAALAGRHFGSILRERGVLLMSLTNAALTAIHTGAIVFLFPLYVVERAGLRPSALGWIVSLNVLGRLVGLWLGGTLSDRSGRMAVLAPGLVGYGALLAALAILAHPVLLGLWSLFLGAAGGLVAGLPTVVIGDRVAAPLRGIAIGWLRTVTDGGFLVGPLVMGAVADTFGLAAPFVVAGVLTGVLAGACLLDRDAT
jgi:MFS family permease